MNARMEALVLAHVAAARPIQARVETYDIAAADVQATRRAVNLAGGTVTCSAPVRVGIFQMSVHWPA